MQLKYLHVTCNYVSLNITTHHYPVDPVFFPFSPTAEPGPRLLITNYDTFSIKKYDGLQIATGITLLRQNY